MSATAQAGAPIFSNLQRENIGAMILAGSLALAAQKAGMSFDAGIVGVMFFPLVARAFGIVASMAGILSVHLKSEDQEPCRR